MHSSIGFDFFLMCSARSECKLKMKMTSKNVKIHESSTFLCLCIVKRPTTYVFCECLLHLKGMNTYISVKVGSSLHCDVAVFHLYIFMYCSCIVVATYMLSLLAHPISC